MTTDPFPISNWEFVGRIPPDRIVPAREELHRAIQLPGCIGRCYARERQDDGHTAMRFRGSLGAVVSEPAVESGIRLGLHLAGARLLFLDHHGGITSGFDLEERTLEEACQWLEALLEEAGEDPSQLRVEPEEYSLPEHPLDEGAAFKFIYPAAFEELARFYANADALLSAVSAGYPHTSTVRTWPHHFDSAVSMSVDPAKSPEEARSVGVGFSPGDASYNEPYWYVTPWPYPEATDSMPTLEGGGHWHTEGWTGAVLPATRLEEDTLELEHVTEFLRTGIDGAQALLLDS